MIFTQNSSVSEKIIDILADGPIDSLLLLEKLKNQENITKQGFYKALRNLLENEVLTKNKQLIFLSPLWTNKAVRFVERLYSNIQKQGSETLLRLAEGDSMVFRFKSILDLYLLWNHYFFIFSKEIEGPVVFFNSHNFWALLRSDIENEMYAWLRDNKIQSYSVIGNNTALDKNTSEYIKKDYGIELAYENSPSIRETIFPAVFGDYVMSTILDPQTVKSINALYKKYSHWEIAVQEELEEIISQMRRAKVVIERNSKKAEKMRKKLMQYFIFYKKN